jgi:hypothetical protein
MISPASGNNQIFAEYLRTNIQTGQANGADAEGKGKSGLNAMQGPQGGAAPQGTQNPQVVKSLATPGSIQPPSLSSGVGGLAATGGGGGERSLAALFSKLNEVANAKYDELQSAMDGLSENTSSADLMKVQQLTTEYTTFLNAATNMMKSTSDAFEAVARNVK